MNRVTKSFYITTAIDYPNGLPHMGHAYEKIVTDAYARWYRKCGFETRFLTGTDENGQKLVKSASEAGVPTLEFVGRNVLHFKKLCESLEIQFDDFIRTTEKRHIEVVHEIWRKLEAKGDIYRGHYEGQYCLACEAFYTETQVKDGLCPNHGTALELVKEEGFFFKLSAYASWIEEYIESHEQFIVPLKSKNEILQRLRAEPVKDLSVSRPNSGWGILVPGDENFVIYTWFDALINYLSAVRGEAFYQKFWPADVHVIGKDITWFHTVIWPCILKAADFPLPKQVYVHGMVLGEDGRKMSKSLGNGVDPQTVLEKVPVDSFRYYILRAIPSGNDGAFVTTDLVARHNSELANDLGNLLSRVVKLAMKKLGSEIKLSEFRSDLKADACLASMKQSMDRREHSMALDSLWGLIQDSNLYVTQKEPWKLPPEGPELRQVLGSALCALDQIAQMLESFMPLVSKRIRESLGAPSRSFDELSPKNWEFHLQDPGILFQKIE